MTNIFSATGKRNPRILIVTPEITYLPQGMGNMANSLTAKAGGLADVSASLVSSLFELGADVHVALPHFRRLFHININKLLNDELRVYKSKLPDSRIHLAEDRVFYYRNAIYSSDQQENPKIALAFQREVINNIIPLVKPDLIHCNDWMTGLIPAHARRLNIPCLYTIHNIHTHNITLQEIEDSGIDAAEFWPYLYYSYPPKNYEESRSHNPVDLLASGIFAGHFINTVSPTFLLEMVDGRHSFVPDNIRSEVTQKQNAGCATGILNAPDPVFNPTTDVDLACRYNSETHVEAKQKNKLLLQKRLGLSEDRKAPLFFWPSRLDPVQKGCQLFTEILFPMISKYWDDNLQVAIIANGAYQRHFRDIVHHHGFHERVAVCDFDESLSHLGYAASDFMLMPSRFEPCGLPQMVSTIYGSLPIAHNTGGLHDTVTDLNLTSETGNGFLFNHYDAPGLMWAIDQAMSFYRQHPELKARQIRRIMEESSRQFTHSVTARKYFEIYEKMLNRPLVASF
jgi:ADP-glucose type glycogen/starch synthase